MQRDLKQIFKRKNINLKLKGYLIETNKEKKETKTLKYKGQEF